MNRRSQGSKPFLRRAHGVLPSVSRSYPPPWGTFDSIPRPFATLPEGIVRLACFSHAASVQSEPGSNSSIDVRCQTARITSLKYFKLEAIRLPRPMPEKQGEPRPVFAKTNGVLRRSPEITSCPVTRKLKTQRSMLLMFVRTPTGLSIHAREVSVPRSCDSAG